MKTQNQNMKSYAELIKHLDKIAEKLSEKLNVKIKTLDIGGGLPEAAILKHKLNVFSEEIKNLKQKLNGKYKIFLEPGRFIIGDAGVLLTKILNIKNLNGKKWIIIDAGTNIISPLSKANHRFVIPNRLLDKYSEEYNIGGPLPASFDVITRNCTLPKKIRKGDVLAILNTGAYSPVFTINYPTETTAKSILI